LNFITKNEEEKIKNLQSNNDKINTIIKIIYILIKENYDEVKNENLIKNLYEKIFPKYRIDSISKLIYNFIFNLNFLLIFNIISIENLFLKYICKNIILPDKDIIRIRNLINDNIEIFDMKYYKVFSVGFSFMIFILKELTDYIIQQTTKGIFIQNLRIIYKKMKKDVFQKNYCIEILQEYSERN
jgi:hypothetical protein